MCRHDDVTSSTHESDANTALVNILVVVCVSITLLALIIVIILILLCLRKRNFKTKQQLQVVENVAYNCHDCEIKTEKNIAYRAVNKDVVSTSNGSCTVPTKIAASIYADYEPVQDSSNCATYESCIAETTLEYDYPRVEN